MAPPGNAVTNWAGNVTFRTNRVYRPESVTELRRVVATSDRLRVLGTGHSFNRIADTDGDLVSVAGLPATVDIDPAGATATVAAGVRYGDLAVRLHRAGFALPSLASLPHISVAGAVATGTHGSGDRLGNLATSVRALELVTAAGGLVRLDRDSDPERFPGAVVALGALGVVTSLTLDLVPTFRVRQLVYEHLPAEALTGHLDEIFGAADSVSVFTDWRGRDGNRVWLKQRVPDPAPAGGPGDHPPREWLGGRLADGPRHPVPGMPPEHCTVQLGAPGPWHTRLPHFRLEYTPSNGEELQSEFFVPRERAGEAVAALRRLGHRIAPVLQVSEIRTVAADDLWLSPCHARDSVAFHFTWVADEAAVTPVVAEIEQRLAPLAVRPHWGKVFTATPAVLAARYPRLADFGALTREFDPVGKLRNDFLDRYLPA